MGANAPRDVLASRYASDDMVAIWGTVNKIIFERKLWIAVLMAQDVSNERIDAYQRVIDQVNLDSIAAREKKLRHDVKARIEEFNALAGHELIHEGMTSRDLTDNVEQMQVWDSLILVGNRTIALLARFAKQAKKFAELDMCGRSHNVPAQVITFGKRFSNWGEELLIAYNNLERCIKHYPIRGIKGAVGTQQDMIDRLDSSLVGFEELVEAELSWPNRMNSVGQIYPRSLDAAVVSLLVQLAAAPSNFAVMVRLMAGHELMHEGFGAEQTGSSAMPHKMNSRTCERINGLIKVLRGFEAMTSQLAGDQWLEGDVSCSVVRRVALQGAFFALDGIYESALTVLDEMEVFPAMIEAELKNYLPFLSTGRIMMAAVKVGIGREKAHKAIKRHAVGAINDIRKGKQVNVRDVFTLELNLNVDPAIIDKIIETPEHGMAVKQVMDFCVSVGKLIEANPDAASYKPAAIL